VGTARGVTERRFHSGAGGHPQSHADCNSRASFKGNAASFGAESDTCRNPKACACAGPERHSGSGRSAGFNA